MAGRWWIEGEESRPVPTPARRSPPAAPARPEQLSAYRSALSRQAALLPRGSARRRAIEKRLVSLTAEILRHELRGAAS